MISREEGITKMVEGITTMVDGAAFAVSHPGLRHGGKLVRVAVPAYGTIRAPVHGTVRDATPVTGTGPDTRRGLAEVSRPRVTGRIRAVHGPRPPTSADEPADQSTDEVPRRRAKAGIVRDPGTGR
ncbi:hypothetical protein [Streptomyces sp. NPDC059466]|uniref:hypothetical protein n=1 Tax=unclassified Streptomyces TaxID=2593676 RepID=UPI003695BDE7